MTAAAAPPTAPPISMRTLQSQLAVEQARSVALQGQLDDLNSLTADLSGAIGTSSSNVAIDGLTAKQLRARLLAAQAKLTAVTNMLSAAQARLAKVNAAVPTPAVDVVVAESPTPAPTPEVVPPPAQVPAPTPRPTAIPTPGRTPEPHD
jgi:hypothetical protein